MENSDRNSNDSPALKQAAAELIAVSLESFATEVQDPRLRELLSDVAVLVRTALLDARQRAAGRRALQNLRDFEVAVTRHALALAAEAKTFREALALMRDDLDEPAADG